MPSFSSSLPKLQGCILCLLILFFGTGCGLSPWSQKPMELPENWMAVPGLDPIRTENPADADLNAAFPPIQRFTYSASVLGQRRFLWKKFQMLIEVSIFADGSRKLRLAGRHPGVRSQTLFDLLVDKRRMTVYFPTEGLLFEGDIPAEGTIFGEILGVEPWDLIPVIGVGQEAAAIEAQWDRRWGHPVLVPSEEHPGGLQFVEFHAETGFPYEARWRRGDRKIKVKYLGWGEIERAPDAETPWVFPTDILVHHRNPSGKLFVELLVDSRGRQQSVIDPPDNARVWQLKPKPGTRRLPLVELEPALRQTLAGP